MTLTVGEENTSPCIFCNGNREFSYRLNDHELYRCINCNTLGVYEIPSEEELFQYYQNFGFQSEMKHLRKIKTCQIKGWLESFIYKKPSRMLDVGGGGGFFAKAFEDFDLGEATYIDLDQSACLFAKEKMNLTRVFHGSADDYLANYHDANFELIYARHVIEHLINPASFILNCAKLLSPSGTLVIQCPNGNSKEGIWFPSYWWKFLKMVAHDNGWKGSYAWAFSMSSKYGWGIDPPRHLWAISGKGLVHLFAQNPTFDVKIYTASLANAVYSPYWNSTTTMGKIRDRICNRLFGSIFSGMHLIALITRKNDQKNDT